MNKTQRKILLVTLGLAGLVLVLSIADSQSEEGPFDFENTGLTWFFYVITMGIISFFLSKTKEAKKVEVQASPDTITYDKLPWYRRHEGASGLVILGLFTGGLTFIPLILVLLTGDVYMKPKNIGGTVRKWSVTNKIVAALLLFGWVAMIISAILGR